VIKLRERDALAKEARKFRRKPTPEGAAALLALISPHRGESPSIDTLIDNILDYLLLVGTIPSPQEVASSP